MGKVHSNGIEIERPALGDLAPLRDRAVVREVRRNADGSWTIVSDADLRFRLPDGRELWFQGPVTLRGKQVGRRPYGTCARPKRGGE